MIKERFKVVVVPHLLLIIEDKILLSRRSGATYGNGKYTLVAGHLEENETVTECMIREAKEEAGIDIDPKDIRVVHVMHRKSADREDIDFFLTTMKWKGVVTNMEPHKCDDLAWYEIEKLPSNTFQYVVDVIKSYKSNILYSEFGW